MHTYTHVHTCMHPPTHTHTHLNNFDRAQILYPYTHTHTCTHMHAPTHVHAHTYLNNSSDMSKVSTAWSSVAFSQCLTLKHPTHNPLLVSILHNSCHGNKKIVIYCLFTLPLPMQNFMAVSVVSANTQACLA